MILGERCLDTIVRLDFLGLRLLHHIARLLRLEDLRFPDACWVLSTGFCFFLAIKKVFLVLNICLTLELELLFEGDLFLLHHE